MADGIEFQIKLRDQISASMKSIANQTRLMQSALTKLDSQLGGVAKSESAVKAGMHEMGDTTNRSTGSMLRAVFGGELLAHTAERVADAVLELGKRFIESAIEATDFGFKAKMAFGAMRGGAEEGQAAFEQAERVARDLGAPVQEIASAMLSFQSAGMKQNWIRPMVVAAHDLAAVNPSVSFEMISRSLQEVVLQGGLAGRTIQMLRSAGVNLDLVAAKLGAHGLQDLQKRLEAHPLGLYQGLRVIQEVIRQQTGESEIGAISKKGLVTVAGSIQRIKTEWDILLDSMNDSASGPFADLRTLMSHIADSFSESGVAGRALRSAMSGIVTEIDKGLKWVAEHPEAVAHAFEEAEKAAKALLDTLGPIAHMIGWIIDHPGLMKIIGAGAAGAVTGGAVGSVIPGVGTAIGAAGGLMVGVNTAIGAVAADEVASSIEASNQSAKPSASAAPPIVKEQLDMASNIPHFASGGVVTSPTVLLAGESGPEAIVPLSGASAGTGSTVHAPISVTVNVDGGHAEGNLDEQRLAELLSEMLPSALISPLEQIATTQGAL